MTSSPPLLWLWQHLRPHAPLYRQTLLASFVINLFALAGSLFAMNVYDRVIPNGATATLWVLSLGYCTVLVFDAVLRLIRSYILDIAGKDSDVILSTLLFRHALDVQLREKPQQTGLLVNLLREFEGVRQFFASSTLALLIDLPFALFFLLMIFAIGGSLVLVPLAMLPLVALVTLVLAWPQRDLNARRNHSSDDEQTTLFTALSGIETIKAHNAGDGFVERWRLAVTATTTHSALSRFLTTLSTTLTGFIGQVMYMAMIIFGTYRIMERELTMGALVACTLLAGRLLVPLGSVALVMSRWQQMRYGLDRLHAFHSKATDVDTTRTYLTRPPLTGAVALKQIRFTYGGAKLPALDAVTLTVSRGEKIGILGRSGSGKTTLARLIAGLYEADEGLVLLDGTDSRQMHPDQIRSAVGYVAQDALLFPGSLLENIRLGRTAVDDARVLQASAVSGLAGFVETHPLGYDLPVGERGETLSGGQRQMTAIARALAHDPALLILDEPTNHLDHLAEAHVIDRLHTFAAAKTMLLITHRLPLLALVDRLIVIDQGRVVRDGPKERILQELGSR
jgi:ATP-binding cassette subfamily C protein LapB